MKKQAKRKAKRQAKKQAKRETKSHKGSRKGSHKDWQSLAERKVKVLLSAARSYPALLKKAPQLDWKVEVQVVGKVQMARMNSHYLGKDYATDVLSFPTPRAFRQKGILGDLVVCLPTLKAQAREFKHAPEQELDVLLVHGLLHLLGFDHERSEREFRQMKKWETRILNGGVRTTLNGLIDRSKSGIQKK